MRNRSSCSWWAAAVLLCACTGGSPAIESGDDGRSLPDRVPAVETEGVVGEVPQALLERILDHAHAHSGAAGEGLRVLRGEAVTWPSGALGCPRPGQMYSQALVPGYRIVIEAGGIDLLYHASQRGHFILCAPPLRPQPGYTGTPAK